MTSNLNDFTVFSSVNIIFACNEYSTAATGGIGTFTKGLAQALVVRGHSAHIIGSYNISRTERETISGVHVSRLPSAHGIKAIALNRLALCREITRIANLHAIDIVESPDFEGPLAWLPRQSRARIVRLHGSHVYFSDECGKKPSRSIRLAEGKTLQQADAIISVSDYTARRTQQLFDLDRDIITIHNSVDVPASIPRKSDYSLQKRAVYFGTLVEKKGVLALADAWRHFHTLRPEWRISFIGRSTTSNGRSMEERILERMSESAASADFHGPITHDALLRELPKFDFAILPSFSEAFALAPMEAMALGVPVIYSSLSSGPELVKHSVNGWLCDPNHIDSLVNSLDEAASSETERERIARCARYIMESQFSYDAFVDKNIHFYEQLLMSLEYRQ